MAQLSSSRKTWYAIGGHMEIATVFQFLFTTVPGLLATIAGIITSYMVIKKAVVSLKEKSDAKQKENFKDMLREILPEMLKEHDLETRNRYLNDRERYLQEIKDEVLKDTKDILTEIKELNMAQSKSIEVLTQSSKDVLRQRIMDIYYRGRDTKTLTIYDKEALDELYKDYKSEHGNSYIDKYYSRMETWAIMDDEDQ